MHARTYPIFQLGAKRILISRESCPPAEPKVYSKNATVICQRGRSPKAISARRSSTSVARHQPVFFPACISGGQSLFDLLLKNRNRFRLLNNQFYTIRANIYFFKFSISPNFTRGNCLVSPFCPYRPCMMNFHVFTPFSPQECKMESNM